MLLLKAPVKGLIFAMTLAFPMSLMSTNALFAANSTEAQNEDLVLERTEKVKIIIETVASGLEYPWGMAFLPDGSFLVTERPGRIRQVDANGTLSPPISGVPPVVARGQGGLLDIIIDPDYASNRFIYFAYVEPRDNGSGVAVARATYSQKLNMLDNVEAIFRQKDSETGTANFGVRLVIAERDKLFITLGDRFSTRNKAQDLNSQLGKILRINTNGTIPADNPFVNQDNALPEIWSLGHRNIQGAALHPVTGELWTSEHGPRGGDEINIIRKGLNYGWPIITYGVDYSGKRIGIGTARKGLEQPVYYWVPSIAPSGLAFHHNGKITPWHESLFVGTLAGRVLVRLEVSNETVTHEEKLLSSLNERMRDVRTGPDGYLYLLTDNSNGRILRIKPSS